MEHEAEHLSGAKAPRHDALTGLYTRTAFLAAAAGELPPEGGVLAVLDIDHFHRVNMRCGHAQGDALLHETARALHELFPTGDILGRVGGDCFAVFAPGGSVTVMHVRAAQLAGWLDRDEARWNVTFSAGITERHGTEPFDAVWARAERLLREGKAARAQRRAPQPAHEEICVDTDLERLHSELREKNAARGALCVDFDGFQLICRFAVRRLKRTREQAHLLLLTLTDENSHFVPLEGREALMARLGEDIRLSLRASDVYTRTSECQYLVLTLGASAANMGIIAGRITARFTARLAGDAQIALRADIAPLGEDTI